MIFFIIKIFSKT